MKVKTIFRAYLIAIEQVDRVGRYCGGMVARTSIVDDFVQRRKRQIKKFGKEIITKSR